MADAAIVFRAESDTSQIRSDMRIAQQEVANATGSMGRSFEYVSGHHENLLRSSHRVASSMRGLTTELLTTGSAADAVGSIMERFGMATNLGLAALAGLEIGGVLTKKLASAQDALEKFREKISELQSNPPKALYDSFSEITSKIKEATNLLKGFEHPGLSTQILEYLKAFGGAGVGFFGAGPGVERSTLGGTARGIIGSGRDEAVRAKARELEISRMSDADAERAKASDELAKSLHEANGQVRLMILAQEKYNDTIEQITEDEQEKRQKAAQKVRDDLTGQLGGIPDKFSNEYSMQSTYAAQQLREATKEDQEAKDAILKYGDFEGAGRHRQRADDIRGGIGFLSNDDKLIGTLTRSEQIQMKIEENTRNGSTPRNR
jgi:hypothetical protein